MKTSTFLLGLTTGAIAAAVTVLYTTPQSGSSLRSSLKDASSEFKGAFGDFSYKLHDVANSLAALTQEAKQSLPVAVQGIKQSLNQWQDSSEPTRARLEKELSAIQEAIESLEQTIIEKQEQ